MENLKLGFLASYSFENSTSVRGAMLVTDENTKPMEFRVTAPIRTSSFQKTLYGELLQEHILCELIMLPLFESLQEKPDIILIRDPLFLKSTLRLAPAILLQQDGEANFGTNIKNVQLNSTVASYPSITIQTSGLFKDKLSEFEQQLQPVFNQRNLIEPFERLALACEDVHNQKIGDK
jgi:hypothetical protein